jgi:hypothetical protein
MLDTRTMQEKRQGQAVAAGVHRDQKLKGHTKTERRDTKAALRKDWTR